MKVYVALTKDYKSKKLCLKTQEQLGVIPSLADSNTSYLIRKGA